jgi:hypothetical protein
MLLLDLHGMIDVLFVVSLIRVYQLYSSDTPQIQSFPSMGLQLMELEEGQIIDVVVRYGHFHSWSCYYKPE